MRNSKEQEQPNHAYPDPRGQNGLPLPGYTSFVEKKREKKNPLIHKKYKCNHDNAVICTHNKCESTKLSTFILSFWLGTSQWQIIT